MLADVVPTHRYIRETSAPVLHHVDYLNRRDDQALCGTALENPIAQADAGAPAICPACEAKLTVYHLEWWRETAQAATAELEVLRVKYRELEEYVDAQRLQSAPAQTEGDLSDQVADSSLRGDEEPQSEPTADPADAQPTTFLDQARRELTELIGQFEAAVPYWRLKNTMQAFSDKLDTHERVLLAEEIGADGSLIRWSTTEVEALGRTVSNSPVQEETAAMWETWHQDSYQPPKKTKRRLGRPRRT
jgi:hypothetical protein